MTHRLALFVLALGLAACSHDDAPSCEGCDQISAAGRTVHDARSKTFTADGVDYTLIRVEYGDTPECSEWDDEDCWYSTYCAFVVDNEEFPLEANWVSDADALFDPALYCEDGELEGCDLPGSELPILDDEAFEAWMYETDPDDEPLADCFAEYW